MKISKKILKEEAETFGQALDKSLDDPQYMAESRTVIGDALDRAMKRAVLVRRTGGKPNTLINPLFIGPAGSAKTSIVEQWAKRHGIACITKIVSQMDAGDLGGALAADVQNKLSVRLGTSEFKLFNEQPAILFLDEVNMAKESIVAQLYTIINEHRDPMYPDGNKVLKHLLFVVGAMNPDETVMQSYIETELPEADKARYKAIDWDEIYIGAQPLNRALSARFTPYYVMPDVDETLNYLNVSFDKMIDKLQNPYTDEFDVINKWIEENPDDEIKQMEGRKALANALLTDKRFRFDDYVDTAEAENRRSTMPRDIEKALIYSDGTKKDFLKAAKKLLNNRSYDTIEAILSKYEEKDDKANQALRGRKREQEQAKKRTTNLIDQLDLDPVFNNV